MLEYRYYPLRLQNLIAVSSLPVTSNASLQVTRYAFVKLNLSITCLDLECEQCTPELNIMYYSAMANCLNYPAYIPFVSGRVVCQQYVILNCLSYPPWIAIALGFDRLFLEMSTHPRAVLKFRWNLQVLIGSQLWALLSSERSKTAVKVSQPYITREQKHFSKIRESHCKPLSC